MKIAVCVKQVPDSAARVVVTKGLVREARSKTVLTVTRSRSGIKVAHP